MECTIKSSKIYCYLCMAHFSVDPNQVITCLWPSLLSSVFETIKIESANAHQILIICFQNGVFCKKMCIILLMQSHGTKLRNASLLANSIHSHCTANWESHSAKCWQPSQEFETGLGVYILTKHHAFSICSNLSCYVTINARWQNPMIIQHPLPPRKFHFHTNF